MPRLGRARGALGERRKAAGARPVHGRAAQRRLINHSAPPRDRGPRRPPPIPAPLPQKQPLPFTGFKGFCACACVCVSVFLSPPPPPPSLSFPSCCFVCVHEKEFFLLPGKRLAPGLRSCEKRARERQADGAKENKHSRGGCMAVGGFEKEKEKAWRGGGGGSCGANESKINIYMGRVLKPYFASL